MRLPASSTASEARARFSTPTTNSSRSVITCSSVAYNLAMPMCPSARRAARWATFGSTPVVAVRNPATAEAEGTARFTMRVRERMVGSTSWALGAHSSQMQCSAGSSISFSSTLVVRSSMRSTSSMMMMRHGAVAGICSEVVMISRTWSMPMVTLLVASTVTSGWVPASTCCVTRVGSSLMPWSGLSSAAANARAMLERPEPGGPQISHDWAIWLGSPCAMRLSMSITGCWPTNESHTLMPAP